MLRTTSCETQGACAGPVNRAELPPTAFACGAVPPTSERFKSDGGLVKLYATDVTTRQPTNGIAKRVRVGFWKNLAASCGRNIVATNAKAVMLNKTWKKLDIRFFILTTLRSMKGAILKRGLGPATINGRSPRNENSYLGGGTHTCLLKGALSNALLLLVIASRRVPLRVPPHGSAVFG